MRPKFFILLVLGSWLSFSSHTGFAQSAGDTANISDDLTVFIHTGPSRNFRIIGSIQAGAAIDVLDRQGDPAFVQITDAEGRTGWVEVQYVSVSGSLREQLPSLQDEVTALNQQLENLQQQQQSLRSENTTLTQQNQRLSKDLEENLTLSAKLQKQVDEADNTAMIEWFTRGGIVAVVCVFLGILLTYLPKKRNRNDQWM